jgi:hypothetical protein
MRVRHGIRGMLRCILSMPLSFLVLACGTTPAASQAKGQSSWRILQPSLLQAGDAVTEALCAGPH